MALQASHTHASALLAVPHSAASRTSHPHLQLRRSRSLIAIVCHINQESSVPPLFSHYQHTGGPASTSCSLRVSNPAVACRSLHLLGRRGPNSVGPRRAKNLRFVGTWQSRWQCVPLAAVKQERLPPGQSCSIGSNDGGGGLDRFFSLITGFPFPIGPNFVRRTIRYEARPIRTPSCLYPEPSAFINSLHRGHARPLLNTSIRA